MKPQAGLSGRAGRACALAAALATTVGLGCRSPLPDFAAQARTPSGDAELAAMVARPDEPLARRVDAAIALASAPPRHGQAVGLARLLDALIQLPAADREAIVRGLWRAIAPKLKLRPVPGAKRPGVDPSGPHADATIAIVGACTERWLPKERAHELDAGRCAELRAALLEWAAGAESDSPDAQLALYEARLDAASTDYEGAYVLRLIGAPAAGRLASLLRARRALVSARVSGIVGVAAALVPAEPREPAEQKAAQASLEPVAAALAALFEETLGEAYAAALEREPEGREARLAGAAVIERAEIVERLRIKRISELAPLLAKVHARPDAAQVIAFAADETRPSATRVAALWALGPTIAATAPSAAGADAQLTALVRLAKSAAPSELRSEALALMKRFEPAKATRALYELFDSPAWKLRYTAAMTILELMRETGARSGTTPHDFLERLPATNALPMGLGEFHNYAKTIAALPAPFAGLADLRAALGSKRLGARLTALGYFVEAGTDADRATLRPLSTATDPAPRCAPADDCGWDRGCDVPKAGAPEELESKPVATVGDYVRYCVLPQIDARSPR
jgi:hypothetical protein